MKMVTEGAISDPWDFLSQKSLVSIGSHKAIWKPARWQMFDDLLALTSE